jgi:hypothetical protein
MMAFQEWWDQTILWIPEGSSLSRGDIVMAMANQDGGAHVDEALDAYYDALRRENAMRIRTGTGAPIKGVELAIVRQIAHEVLKTLDPAYSCLHKPPSVPGGLVRAVWIGRSSP